MTANVCSVQLERSRRGWCIRRKSSLAGTAHGGRKQCGKLGRADWREMTEVGEVRGGKLLDRHVDVSVAQRLRLLAKHEVQMPLQRPQVLLFDKRCPSERFVAHQHGDVE